MNQLARLAVLILFSSGCIDVHEFLPGDPWDPGSCGEIPKAHVRVDVENGTGRLTAVRLVSQDTIRLTLSCVGPNVEERLAGNNESSAAGRIDAQDYHEVDLFFEDRVVRIATNLSLLVNGTLTIDLADPTPQVRWNGQPVTVARSEVLGDPNGLEPARRYMSRPLTANVNETLDLVVNTTWNQGMSLMVTVHWDYKREDPRGGTPDMPGGWLVARAHAPNGTVVEEATLVEGERDIRIVRGPLEQGLWRLHVAGQPPEWLQEGHVLTSELLFAY